jgi:hypothetical protein
MRWIMLLAAIAGFAVVFTTKSPGMLGLGLLFGLGGLFGFALAWAAARIASTAQPTNVLIIDPEVNALRAKARLQKPSPALSETPRRSARRDSMESDPS